MKECDNSKIHISSNFVLSISLLIMFDTLLLRPSRNLMILQYTRFWSLFISLFVNSSHITPLFLQRCLELFRFPWQNILSCVCVYQDKKPVFIIREANINLWERCGTAVVARFSGVFLFSWRNAANGPRRPHYRGFMVTDTPHFIGILWTSDRSVAETAT